MTDAFTTKAVADLNGEIACLTGGGFEQFGHAFLCAVLGEDFEARGTTIHGAPRGYTVDATANGASDVYEASSVESYFDKSLLKLQDDLNHAIKKHPTCKRIWLLSGEEKTPTAGTGVANLISTFKTTNASVTDVFVWGSREIATKIVENLESDVLVERLRSYLPSLARLADENAFSHQLPSRVGYVSRPIEERELTDRLRAHPVVTMVGISGSGKSLLACTVADQLRGEFQTVVWLDGSSLKDASELQAVPLGRYGLSHSISGLAKRRKTLIVLDDVNGTISGALGDLTATGSRILITTQSAEQVGAFSIPAFSESEARQLLERDALPCPDDVFLAVWKAVGGYPLLLSVLNREAVASGDWGEVRECCRDVVESSEDDRHNKVCQRILAKHASALSCELAFVRWVGAPRFDQELARVCAGSRAIENLAKRAFLSATQAGMARVHDVVYRAVLATVPPDSPRYEEFRLRLAAFIAERCGGDADVLHRMGRRHAALLTRLQQQRRIPEFAYALGLARTPTLDLSLLLDPLSHAAELAARTADKVAEIDVRAVIESIEATYTVLTDRDEKDAAKVTLTRQIAAFDDLLAAATASEVWRRDIRHHRAKMRERLGQADEALADFETLIGEFPNHAASRLQLARLLAKRKRQSEAATQALAVVEHARRDPGSFSVNVLLESLRVVASEGSEADLEACDKYLESTVRRASETDIGVVFRLVARVAAKAWFRNPALVLRLFDLVEWAEYSPSTDTERFDWAQAHKFAAKAATNRAGDHADKSAQYLQLANGIYSQLAKPNAFHATQHAEALILAREFADARDRLLQVPESQRMPFWHQRQAQALLGLGRAADALLEIECAIGAPNPEDKYLPAFVRDRANIKRSLGSASARQDLVAARDLLAEGDKFREQVEEELASWPEEP